MTTREQLEIISPAGEVIFYDLNPAKGTTNIGRHPDNDVILHGTGIAHFHAIIDHRQLPYQVLVLSEEGKTSLEGIPLPPNSFTPIELWHTIQLDDYTIMLVENQEGIASEIPSEPAPIAPALPQKAETATGGTYMLATTTEVQPPEEILDIPEPPPTAIPFENNFDPSIPVQLSDREWVIEVTQTAVCELTFTNGGERVAAFEVQVHGVPDRWVNIAYPKGQDNESKQQVELAEGEKATVTISITPPRTPSSRAGTHYLGLSVVSPTYGRSSQAAAKLLINPYYEFAVGELAHKQQALRWPKDSVQTELTVANLSNAPALFLIEASDDEKACDFEFKVPNKEGSFVNQAEYRLQSREAFNVPIQISPHKPPKWMGKRRNYSFTANVSMREGQQAPYSRRGQVTSVPAVRPALYMPAFIALFFLFLAILVWIFRPAIQNFETLPAAASAGESVIIRAGDPLTLTWKASPFANLTLSEEYESLEEATKDVEITEAEGTKPVFPPNDTVKYRLKGENFLSKLLSFIPFLTYEEILPVKVEKVLPEITYFTVNDEDPVYGDRILLNWGIQDATKLTLYINPPIEGVGDVVELEPEPTGTYDVRPAKATTFRLEATHEDSELTADKNLEVRVHPEIRAFDINTDTIPFWGSVTLNWAVFGADQVVIDKIGEVESYGVQAHSPGEEGMYTYRLIAYNGDIEGSDIVTVSVGRTPQTPQINKFEFEKAEVIQGDVNTVNLSWDISGDIDRIEITGPDFEYVSSNDKEKMQGVIAIPADESKNFLLKAFGLGDPQPVVSKMAALNVIPPTPTPLPTETPVPTPTATPIPPNPEIAIFSFSYDENAYGQFIDYDPSDASCHAVYNVDALSDIEGRLNWNVRNATNITLRKESPLGTTVDIVGDSLETGETAITGVSQDIRMRQTTYFHLVAVNPGAEIPEVTRSICIVFDAVINIEAPDNVDLLFDRPLDASSSITIAWTQYDPQEIIAGYVIQREIAGVADYQEWTMENTGDQIISGGMYKYYYVDSALLPNTVDGNYCGYTYRVAAYYFDAEGDPRYSDFSDPVYCNCIEN